MHRSMLGSRGDPMMEIQEILNRIAVAQQHLTDDIMFRNCVSETLMVLQVEDIDLANELAVSRSTVNRWKNGASVPHPAMRKPVYAALKRRAQTRLRDAKRAEEPSSSGEKPICN
jgi:transcriptional regulator with XRE-family HTH domain